MRLAIEYLGSHNALLLIQTMGSEMTGLMQRMSHLCRLPDKPLHESSHLQHVRQGQTQQGRLNHVAASNS